MGGRDTPQRWLVLDVDDTLVDTHSTGFRKCQLTARRLGLIPPSRRRFAWLYGTTTFEQVVAQLHPGIDLVRYAAVYDSLSAAVPPEPLLDGAKLARAAQDSGLHLGVLTNGPAHKTARKLEAVGLPLDRLGFVVSAGEGYPRKPAVAAFTALAQFGVQPERSWYVGDAGPEWSAAQEAGFGTIAVQGRPALSSRRSTVPDVVVGRAALLEELVPALAPVLRRRAPGEPEQPVAAVAFDVGFTLVDHRRSPEDVVRHVAHRAGRTVTLDDVRLALRTCAPVLSDLRAWRSDPEIETMLRRFYGQVLARLGVPAEVQEVPAVLSEYTSPGNWRALPGARRALAAVAGRGLAVVVFSNWQSGVGSVLAAAGLGDDVDHVVASAALGMAKPDPACFAAVAARVGVPVQALTYVGDDARSDATAVLNAGGRAVLVSRCPAADELVGSVRLAIGAPASGPALERSSPAGQPAPSGQRSLPPNPRG